MNEHFSGYHAFLKEEINKFKDTVDPSISHIPDFFMLLADLLNILRIDKKDRRKICSALAYFVAPGDWIPEELHGPSGYIDDVYLSCYVLDKLSKKYGIQHMNELWEGGGNFEEVLKKSLESSKKFIEKSNLKKKILEYVGLK